jgi:hypothetical protein
MTGTPHNASYQPQPDGEYLITCDRGDLHIKEKMTRNQAHDTAYLHTMNPGDK